MNRGIAFIMKYYTITMDEFGIPSEPVSAEFTLTDYLLTY